MGMSASQARLIALTARMNDIEYQGQQINQQRTTLSSQVNALYNTLLEMDVPTPPSTLDYQKTVYTGVSGASRFTMEHVIPTGKNTAGNNTYSVDLSYQMTGHSVQKGSTTVSVQSATHYFYFKEVPQNTYMISHTTPQYQLGTTPLSTLPAYDPDDNTADDIVIKMTKAEFEALSAATRADLNATTNQMYAGSSTTTLKTISDISSLDPSDYIYIKCNSSDVKAHVDLANLCGIITTDSDSDGVPDVDSDGNLISWDETNMASTARVYSPLTRSTDEITYSGYVTDTQILQANLYAVFPGVEGDEEDDRYYRITSAEELDNYLAQTGGMICQFSSQDAQGAMQIKNSNWNQEAEDGTGLTVGTGANTMIVYDMNSSTVIAILGETSYNDYLEALRNSFPELDRNTIADKFYVYIESKTSGAMIPHFIKKDEMGNLNKDVQAASVYDYDEDGTYTQRRKTNDCELEFDASTGRISKLGIPDGNGQVIWVELEATTETDQEAYSAAFNNYEYEKVKYDREQQLINQKTSIIQAEDKSLELKLTRLDNERNAVNTELDAVKKVVQDNIEKSFKTFSG